MTIRPLLSLRGGHSPDVAISGNRLPHCTESHKNLVFVFCYRAGGKPQGRFGCRFPFCDLSADFGELGNLRLERCWCCSLSWWFGSVIFPAHFPCWWRFPQLFGETMDGGCCEGHSRGDKERCFEAIRRQIVGEGEEASLLCDCLPRRFWLRIRFS